MLKILIKIKAIRIARGRRAEIRAELRRCITITTTTIMVTRISSDKAEFKVSRVS